MVNFSHHDGICHSTNIYQAVLWVIFLHVVPPNPLAPHEWALSPRFTDEETGTAMLGRAPLGPQLVTAKGRI